MKSLIVLLIVLGALMAAMRLFVKQASARRRLTKPLLENRPVLDSTIQSCTAAALKKPPAIDATVMVAIAAAVNATTPGARITQIEEEFQVMESS